MFLSLFQDGTMNWIKSSFIGNNAHIISLLSRDEFYPQQSVQEAIEVTQLHIHIVKVLLRCIMMLENWEDYDSLKLESLLKILLACLEKIDLRNFHILGKFVFYLNAPITEWYVTTPSTLSVTCRGYARVRQGFL